MAERQKTPVRFQTKRGTERKEQPKPQIKGVGQRKRKPHVRLIAVPQAN